MTRFQLRFAADGSHEETTRDFDKRDGSFVFWLTETKDGREFDIIAKDKEIADRWRGFADVADSRHLANRVEREVVDALSTAVTAAYPSISHRYYAMKAK